MTSRFSTTVNTAPADVVLTSRLGKFKFHAISATRVGGRIGDETGDGYVNAGPSWEYRGAQYAGSVYFNVAPDGTLTASEVNFFKTLGSGAGNAPKTYAAAMAEAMRAAVAEYLGEHPEELRKAQLFKLREQLYRASEDEDKARSVLHGAESRVKEIRAQLAQLEAQDDDARAAVPIPVTTWADGFGVWHVRVSESAVSPIIAARRALRTELEARQNNVDPHVWKYPIHVAEMDGDGTVVYREGNPR